jgi:hypothetical protein
MSQKFYKLTHDVNRFQPDGVGEFGDGYLESKFSNWEKVDSAFYSAIEIELTGDEGVLIREQQENGLWKVAKVKMPVDLVFIGFDDLFVSTDYPYIRDTRLWPIVSKRMLNVLLSLGSFSYQAIPITFKYVDNFSSDEEEREKVSLIRNHDFVVLQLLEYLDALDMEKSDYTKTPYESNPKAERINIRKMVLKEPIGGFPPVFRVKENEIPLYVSAAAKEALEKAGIKGLDFSSYNIESS